MTSENSRSARQKGEDRTRRRRWHRIAIWVLLLCTYGFGVILRWDIVRRLQNNGDDVPYTQKSELFFHYADMFARGKRIPTLDKQAQYPEGLAVERSIPLGKGIVGAMIYRTVGSPGTFREFLRRFDAAWFCLGIVALFLAIREMGGGDLGGLMAAAVYAVSLPSIARSTGLEFNNENFSLPLMFLHWWLVVRGWKQERLSLSSIGAGVLLAVAVATWNGAQLYVLLIGVFAGLNLLFGKDGFRLVRWFLPGLACLVVAAVMVPYLRGQKFILSWPMLVWYSLAGAFLVGKLSGERKAVLPKMAFALLLVCLAVLVHVVTAMPGTYPAYGRLFLAKVTHMNVKPADPAKLSYETRILWEPESHWASGRLDGKHNLSDFRILFLLASAPLVLLIRSMFRRSATGSEKALLYWIAVLFVLYVFFVSMEVFLAFFICCLIGLGVRCWASLLRHGAARTAVLSVWALLLLMGLAGEAYSSFRLPRIYKLKAERSRHDANRVLARWLRDSTEENAVILADFALEPTILVEAERTIVLHPELECKKMRVKIKEYLESLFSENEKDFHDFCLKYGVNYYVLDREVFRGPMNPGWIYSNRYLVDRAERYPEYASLAMRYNTGRLQYFRWVKDVSRKGDPSGFFYRAFKVVSGEEMDEAEQHVRNAGMYLDNYRADGEAESLQLAESELLKAAELFPGSAEAHSMLSTVYTIKGESNKASLEIERWKQILADRTN